MLWLFLTIICLFFNVSFTIISRINLSTKTTYTNAYTILWEMMTAFISFAFLPFGIGKVNLTGHIALIGILSLLLYTMSNFFIFHAFKYEEASVLSVIFPLNNLFTFIAAIILFKAIFTQYTIIGFLLILLATILSQYFQSKFHLSKGSGYGMFFALFIGLALAFDTQVVKSFSVALFTILTFLIPAILNQFIFLRPKWSELLYELKNQPMRLFLNALTQSFSTFFLYKAFTVGSTLQVISVFALSTIIVTLVSIIFLKERDHIWPKVISAIIATLGVIIVNL